MKPSHVIATEQMFATSTRMSIVEEIVSAAEDNALERALRKLRPMMESDLEQLLLDATKSPLAVRLLHTPLPQLLQEWKHSESNHVEVGAESIDRTTNRMEGLFPAVHDMQLEALFRAWLRCRTRGEYRIPLVVLPTDSHEETDYYEQMTDMVAKQVLGEEFKYCHYRIERESGALA